MIRMEHEYSETTSHCGCGRLFADCGLRQKERSGGNTAEAARAGGFRTGDSGTRTEGRSARYADDGVEYTGIALSGCGD